jgi:polyhydroxyalkanoate synthesis repressor PhaR
MAKNTVLIKKYENRRLYDTTNSRYVNLEEVAQLLQQGNDVQVVDASTNEDITRLILTQIIVEDAKAPNSTFPLDLLRQMVVTSGRASQESALKYMKTMLEIYQNTYRAMVPPMNPFDFGQNLRPEWETRREEPRPVAENSTPGVRRKKNGGQKKNGRQDTDEVKELKKRLAELEKLVSRLVPNKS